MFGIGVGLLTEYATGVSFVDQIKMTVRAAGGGVELCAPRGKAALQGGLACIVVLR